MKEIDHVVSYHNIVKMRQGKDKRGRRFPRVSLFSQLSVKLKELSANFDKWSLCVCAYLTTREKGKIIGNPIMRINTTKMTFSLLSRSNAKKPIRWSEQ